MQPEDYQVADEGAVAAMLASASLASDMATLTSFVGFLDDFDDADVLLAEPTFPPAKPRAGVPWKLDFTRSPSKRLAGNVGARFAVLDAYITIQPNISAAEGPRSIVLAMAKAIKTHLLAQATPSHQVDAEVPMVALPASASGFRVYRQLIPMVIK